MSSITKRIVGRFPLIATAALGLLAVSGVTAMAQLPKVPRPSLPSVPTPNIPTPNIPTPNIPRPNVPGIPTPNIPRPNVPDVRPPSSVSNAIEEAKKQAARADELRRQADELRRQTDELRKRAERVVGDFNRMKDEAEKARKEYDRLSKLAKSDRQDPQKEAYRALASAGALKSSRGDVVKGIDRGAGAVVWGREFDHLEELKLASALSASVASANPGPALLYIKQFALATKAEVLRNLRAAPAQVQRKAQDEFERLLVEGLNAAVKGQRPPGFGLDGVDLTVAMATYNHWVDVRLNQPRLVATEKILGIQMYRIATDPLTVQVPLPNTFQPYLKLAVRTTR